MKLTSEKKKGMMFIGIALLCGIIAFAAFLGAGSKMSPSVPVLVAITNINPGQPLHKEMFETKKLPEAGLPSYLVPVDTEFTAVIAAHGLSEGDILRETALLFLDDGNPSFFSARLRSLDNPDLRAVEIPLENFKGLVTGMNIQDYVDIVAIYKKQSDEGSFFYGVDGQRVPVREEGVISKTIIHAAPVVGVHTLNRDPKATESQSEEVLVVALTEEQVEVLSLYRELGKVCVSLRPFGTTGTPPQLKPKS